MVDDWVIKTMYATKRRRKNPKIVTNQLPGVSYKMEGGETGSAKSNPSKRHRERLNAELEHLASLLPFDPTVITKLDKLSILRLAVSYLRMKGYFQALSYDHQILDQHRLVSHLYPCPLDLIQLEGKASMQALNGFIFIVSCDGEVFSVCNTVEHYLGFHQSDILHQSVMELIHSEDRDEFHRQLSWQAMLPPEHRNLTLQEVLSSNYCHLLQRCFTVRFRCLLDNTSGFITLEISGRLQFLHGHTQNFQMSSCRGAPRHNAAAAASDHQQSNRGHTTLSPSSFGLFGVCSPLGSLPSLDGSQRESSFKTKHKLDLAITSMDSRANALFDFYGSEDRYMKFYDLVHPDDLNYVAQGHREVCKRGSVGLLSHRWLSNSGKWVWLQSRLKTIYKDSKPDHIVAIHRKLDDTEGRELYYCRNSEYKLPFPLLEPETLMSEDDSSDGPICDSSKHILNTASSENKPSSNEPAGVQRKNSIQDDQDVEKIWNGVDATDTSIPTESKCAPSKKFKGQLKDYLQATRRRKAPPKSSKSSVSRPATSYYPPLEVNHPNTSTWHNYRNLFGRNFSLTPTPSKVDEYSQVYAHAYGYHQNAYSYQQAWDCDRTKTEEDGYSGMMSSIASSALDNSQLNYSLPYTNSCEYNSAYEAYSAAVAAAAVVAAASSNQNHCGMSLTNYNTVHDRNSYDGSGGIHVIRSPMHYAATSTEHQNLSMLAGYQQDSQVLPFACYTQSKDQDDREEHLTTKPIVKTDASGILPPPSSSTSATWFQHTTGLNSLSLPGDMKLQHRQTPMMTYQPHVSSTTDTTAREIAGYPAEFTDGLRHCEGLLPWNNFEARISCVADENICDAANYHQLGFTAIT